MARSSWMIPVMVGVLCGCGAHEMPLLAKLSEERLVDLTHSFDEQTIYWPTEDGFALRKRAEGMTARGYFYAANEMELAEHGGTHIDAPFHFYKDGRTVDEIPLVQLMGQGVLVDVSAKCESDVDYRVQVEDLKNWERRNGVIPEGAIVLIHTGFGRFWPDRRRYMATDDRGAEAAEKLHFPGLHVDAADWLRAERSIKAIGLDTPSIDYGQSRLFRSHVSLFSGNIPALENVANLDRLPPKGFSVIALPMKIKNGTGGPTRIVAILQ